MSPASNMSSDRDIVNKPTLHAAHLRLGDGRLRWLMLGSIYISFSAAINHH